MPTPRQKVIHPYMVVFQSFAAPECMSIQSIDLATRHGTARSLNGAQSFFFVKR